MALPATYPLPSFHFSVTWGGNNIGFSEVSGLSQEISVIEYRDGNNKIFSTIKQPGLAKYTNITLKRGIVKSDNDFWKWLTTVQTKDIETRDVTISLLNENHEPVMTWSATKCWPVKTDGPSFKANGNEIAIETIEIATEGVTIKND